MSLDQEAITQQLALLAAHRRTLAVYLRQQAELGVLAPPGIINGIAETQNVIRRIKDQLRADGVLVGGLLGGLRGGLLIGLTSALGGGPGVGLRGGLRGTLAGRFENIKVIETLGWSWSRDVLVGVLVGVLASGLASGLVFGLVLGLVGGLVAGLGGNEMNSRTTPNQGIHRSARSMLVVGLVSGLVSGLVWGLVWGLVFGLGFGIDYGGRAVFQHYTLRWLLYRNGSLPFRDLVPFLDYCAERIFLRKVGGGYIFVHRLLMEHFASLHTENKGNGSGA